MVGPTYKIVIFSWLKFGPLAIAAFKTKTKTNNYDKSRRKRHSMTGRKNAWTVSTSRCPIQSLRKLF